MIPVSELSYHAFMILLRLCFIVFVATLKPELFLTPMWSNFHMHCNYCDGKAEMIEYVQQAKSMGMLSIGFSSHAPVSFPCLWCMKAEKFDSYLQSIETLKDSVSGIEIYKGLEVDFIPGIVSVENFRKDLDYTIGSIHFVDRYPDGRPWEIDGMHTLFLDGLEKIFQE